MEWGTVTHKPQSQDQRLMLAGSLLLFNSLPNFKILITSTRVVLTF